MKNKKFKLFASLTSLVMVVAVMAVGVWAATTSATATINATASFSVTNIGASITLNSHANVTAKTTEAGQYAAIPAEGLQIVSTTIANSDATATGSAWLNLNVGSLAVNGIVQDEATIEVTYTVKLDSNSAAATVTVTPAAGYQATEGKYSITAAGTVDDANLAAGETTTVTVTYTFNGEHKGEAITDSNVTVQGISIAVTKA